MLRRIVPKTKEKVNKRGQMGIVYFFVLLFFVLLFGIFMAFGAIVVDWVSDEATPVLSDLGMVGDVNLSEAMEYTIVPVHNFIQQWTWMSGVIYIMMLLGVVGLGITSNISGSKWLMGFFFALILLLVISSIFISNIYEEFYTGTDEMATRLQEHVALSHLVINAPIYFTIIAFISGIFFFVGRDEFG